ncbi:MAG: nuclear transport factor 2 family protein [Planctomycetota bacterium]
MPDATRFEVMEAVNRLGFSMDTGNWQGVRGCLADTLYTDYTSLVGGDPAEVSADDLVAAWKQAIEPLDAIQHVVGSHLVTLGADEAVSTAQGIVSHRFGERELGVADVWTVAGHYEYKLSKAEGQWKIRSAEFTLLWETGDRGVMERAANAAS